MTEVVLQHDHPHFTMLVCTFMMQTPSNVPHTLVILGGSGMRCVSSNIFGTRAQAPNRCCLIGAFERLQGRQIN